MIDLCEIKYCRDDFRVTKAYSRELKQKLELFEQRTGTKKDVRLTLVTTYGLQANTWSEDLIDSVVTADALFG